jgi:SAM-dependent methyltransferase
MTKFYVTSACLTARNGQVAAVFDDQHQKTQVIDNSAWLTILELFIHERSVEAAYQRFQTIPPHSVVVERLRRQGPARGDMDTVLVHLADHSLRVVKSGVSLDCSTASRQTCQVLTAVFHQAHFVADASTIGNVDAFHQAVCHLVRLGLLSPARHTIDWGDLRRTAPFCPMFGLTRGTPIDRYYLAQFIREIRPQVTGTVLEVGGVVHNRERYRFDKATSYQTLDVADRPGVTLVGNVHDAATLPVASLDAVVLFNVLEHCQHPWVVVDNMHRWLRASGKCFCMVPSAQRLHAFPGDYWRPLPDGLQQLFRGFSQQQLYVYGNPLTVVASFLGIAAEELSPQELDEWHPEYPVATCVVATK